MHTLDSDIVRRHRLGIIIGAATLSIVALWMPTLDFTQQFWIMLAPVAIFGMSHGGADPIIIKALGAARGRSSAKWLGAYLGLMSITIAFILWQPVLALAGFLLLSIWHFAALDRLFMPPGTSALVGWLSGSLPIVAPMAGHPEQVAVLFAWLLQQDVAALTPIVKTAGIALLLAWGTVLGVAVLRTARLNRLRILMELGILAAPLLLLPPLLGFTFYFCAVHSMRHFMLIFISQRRVCPTFDTLALVRRAAPATLGAIALGLISWWGMHHWSASLDTGRLVDGIRVVFWGLAVLTVPHALLVALWIALPLKTVK